ncbi:MAG TPA: SDR family NAD(P)-dependent oxidoreductase [Paludibaculum sp.]|jgi:NAD(P)-dependent dehydrogenase (short-subunit alcohol dehydrogenase family)
MNALITGASQGIGRGIALSLAATGATVYITGRDPHRLAQTAHECQARGGTAHAIRCDHTVDAEVDSLFEQLPALDLLVNNVWGGYESYPRGLPQHAFWQLRLADWDAMFSTGLRPHFAAARLAAPAMIQRRAGLIINTLAWVGGQYVRPLPYDLVKQALARMTYSMALELKPHQVAVVALAPGFVRTERILAAHAAHPFDLSITESPEYTGRAVAHLAADPSVLGKSGHVLTVGQLAREYNFTDVDSRQPPPFELPPSMRLD